MTGQTKHDVMTDDELTEAIFGPSSYDLAYDHNHEPIIPAYIVEWARAFDACRSTAFFHCPNEVYQELRAGGYLDIQNDLTEKGSLVIRM